MLGHNLYTCMGRSKKKMSDLRLLEKFKNFHFYILILLVHMWTDVKTAL